MKPYFETENGVLYQGDCLDLMAGIPDNSVDCVITDPPYFKVKKDAWDRQWSDPGKFLEWLNLVAEQWHRILKPNGSIYCFASPKMAARVEVMMTERFHIINRITWAKPKFSTKAEMFRKTDLRSFFPVTETILFCEHYGADNIAKGEAGYGAKCDELRGFVFEPLRTYLRNEWERAGLKPDQANEACGTASMAGRHYFTRSQWCLPTKEHYESLRRYANSTGGDYLRREYDYLRREYEDLRREYEDLRREYEDLRRPFQVSSDVPYTDVWDFPTVQAYPGKHPCEKPAQMLEHMIESSTREDAVVLDCFAGSGTTAIACLKTGRKYILMKKEPEYCETIARRINQETQQLRLFA